MTFRRKDNQSRLKVSSIEGSPFENMLFSQAFRDDSLVSKMNLYCFELRIRSVSKGGLRYVHRACFFLSKLPKDTDSERILDKVGGGSAEKGIFSRWKIDDLSLAMGVFINNLVTILRDIRPSSFFSCRGGVRVSRFFPRAAFSCGRARRPAHASVGVSYTPS